MPEVVLSNDDGRTLDLPGNWTVQQVASPAFRPAGDDWPDQVAMAVARPISGPPLGKLIEARRTGRIVIVVEDITRHSPLGPILGAVMNEIHHAGVPAEMVEVVFATGMHPPMTRRQMLEKLDGACAGARMRCNPWSDRSAYVSVGTSGGEDILLDASVAGADLRVLVSSVSPHLQAGFGGGYKMLFPGCAHIDTIRRLHRMGLGRSPRQLVGTDAEANVMRAGIDAAGAMADKGAGRSFSIQYVLDERDRPSFIAAGEVEPVQRMMAKQCAVACGVVLTGPADVVIADARPRDFDLWQSFKCLANTMWAARPGGVVICLSQCGAGLNGMNPPRWPISPRRTRRIIRLLGAEAIGSMLTRFVPSLAGDAAFFVRLALRAVYRNRIILASKVLRDSGACFPGLELMSSPREAVSLAASMLGDGPQRATVFPFGGITFPVPPRPAAGGGESAGGAV